MKITDKVYEILGFGEESKIINNVFSKIQEDLSSSSYYKTSESTNFIRLDLKSLNSRHCSYTLFIGRDELKDRYSLLVEGKAAIYDNDTFESLYEYMKEVEFTLSHECEEIAYFLKGILYKKVFKMPVPDEKLNFFETVAYFGPNKMILPWDKKHITKERKIYEPWILKKQ